MKLDGVVFFLFFFFKSLLLIQVKWQNCFLAAFKNRACIHLNLVSALASLGYDPKKKKKTKNLKQSGQTRSLCKYYRKKFYIHGLQI